MKTKALAKRSQPSAYLIEEKYSNLVEKLKLLGIKVNQLNQSTIYDVETYKVVDYSKNTIPYEKQIMQSVKTTLIPEQKTFPAGTFIIYTNQKNTPLLNEILEPELPNSFVRFGLIKTEPNQKLPIYRIPRQD